MFKGYFLLKKENYPISAFDQSLFSTKKSPKVANLLLTDETLFEFLTSQTGQTVFPVFKSYHEVVMYLFNSLAKSCTIF